MTGQPVVLAAGRLLLFSSRTLSSASEEKKREKPKTKSIKEATNKERKGLYERDLQLFATRMTDAGPDNEAKRSRGKREENRRRRNRIR